MLHEIEGVEQERARVSERPDSAAGIPVLTCVEVAPSGDPQVCSDRLRDVLAAVFGLAVRADFDEDEIPVDTLPGWFVDVCDASATTDALAVEGREKYRERTGAGPWKVQDWLSRFDPELEARGWAFWDLTRSPDDSGRLRIWLDTWGEPFFSWEDVRWLAHVCGADSVADPVVARSEQWAGERSV